MYCWHFDLPPFVEKNHTNQIKEPDMTQRDNTKKKPIQRLREQLSYASEA